MTSLLLLSAKGLAFANGANGLLVGAAALSTWSGALAITVAMAAGGVMAARRVAETMAHDITPIPSRRGLLANLTTSGVVVAASRCGLPVSTTRISTGSIVGIGGATSTLRWSATGQILAAWVTTVPLAAALGSVLMWGLRG